jgi:hypothetical protein
VVEVKNPIEAVLNEVSVMTRPAERMFCSNNSGARSRFYKNTVKRKRNWRRLWSLIALRLGGVRFTIQQKQTAAAEQLSLG